MVNETLIAAAGRAAREVLPEGASLARGLVLPRGADAFVGAELPLVLVASRWARVACGGVLLGGSFAAMTALFGLDAAAARVEADPATRPAWEEELRVAGRVLSSAVSVAVLELGELPAELSPTTVSRCTAEDATRDEVGQISDAVAFVVYIGALSVRMVVAVPGVLTARLSRDPYEAQVGPEHEPNRQEPPALPDASRPVTDPLAWVPIDLAIELGRARVPMAAVMLAGEGELLELDRAFDDAVALVSEVATVALGELEVNDRNRLEFCITSVNRPTTPTLVPDLEVALQGESDHDLQSLSTSESHPPDAPELNHD